MSHIQVLERRNTISRCSDKVQLNATPPTSAYQQVYRSDIDGLRALAVVAVVGYHLQVSWLSGGFVGVDIFFVISGYLIGALVIKQVRIGDFSLAGFYVRRIRRIVPAFVAMIFGVYGLSYFYLFPTQALKFATSAIFASLSISNIYFLDHTGYFDAASATQPLLHTWSLAVEEQFYVAFPLLIMIVSRYRPALLTASLVLIAAFSFVLAAYGAYAQPDATFYLALPRAWELLLGTVIAIQPYTSRLPSITRNLLAILGAGMIAIAILHYTFETPFPGFAALLPCIGAALIILAGQSGPSWVSRFLSLRPVVFVGLISYSLYLWHWPIIFFQESNSLVIAGASRPVTHLAVFAACLAAATLSWRFVERPFRRVRVQQPDWKVFAGGCLGLGSVVMLALLVISAGGLPSRFKPEAVAYAGYLDYGQAHFREGKCFIVPPYKFSDFDKQECLGHAAGQSNVLLVGDSHAAHLWYGLSNQLPGVHVLQATAAGCAPVAVHVARVAPSCNSLMDFIFNDYLPNNHVDRVLISARWTFTELPGIEKILSWAKERSIPVTLFGPMVEYDLALPRVLAYAAQKGDPAEINRHLAHIDKPLDNAFAAVAAKYGAQYVSFYQLLCSAQGCVSTTPDGSPLEFDTDHLTKEGSLFVAQTLIDAHQLRPEAPAG